MGLGFLKNMRTLLNRGLPELGPPLDNFIEIVDLLEALSVSYEVDITSGRGFEYYTGAMFQLFVGEEQIGGGGRYDALIPLMGGRNIPASGFALYLDPLMNLMKPETLAEPMSRRILVTVKSRKPEELQQSFTAVTQLRDAGYVAELGLGTQPPANFRWALEIKPPLFVLTDRVKRKKFKVQTTNEVLALLGEEGADKASST